METVNIIGTGNVAWHITKALHQSKCVKLKHIVARYPILKKEYLDFFEDVVFLEDLQPADITIIAVSDDAISEVSKAIPFSNQLVVHTSGSIALNDLSNANRKGVLYPLQSFSKNTLVDFDDVPICLEWEHEADFEILRVVAFALSKKVHHINSEERKQLHLSAVFANNFVNHCYTVAENICSQKQLDFDLLRPLLEMTLKKALLGSPRDSQTGPAMRDDQSVMDTHLKMLSSQEQKEIYKAISTSITKTYGKKL